jgi:hypothetical protein
MKHRIKDLTNDARQKATIHVLIRLLVKRNVVMAELFSLHVLRATLNRPHILGFPEHRKVTIVVPRSILPFLDGILELRLVQGLERLALLQCRQRPVPDHFEDPSLVKEQVRDDEIHHALIVAVAVHVVEEDIPIVLARKPGSLWRNAALSQGTKRGPKGVLIPLRIGKPKENIRHSYRERE